MLNKTLFSLLVLLISISFEAIKLILSIKWFCKNFLAFYLHIVAHSFLFCFSFVIMFSSKNFEVTNRHDSWLIGYNSHRTTLSSFIITRIWIIDTVRPCWIHTCKRLVSILNKTGTQSCTKSLSYIN